MACWTTRGAVRLVALLVALTGCSALQLHPLRTAAGSHLQARTCRSAPAMGPAPAIAKPKTQTKSKTFGSTGNPGGGSPAAKQAIAKPRRKEHTEDVPMWKVVLLGDEEYEEEGVCEVLLSVVPEIENLAQAGQKYQEAQNTGKSLLITVPKEHAEAYVEQLIRAEPMVFAEAQEE